VIHWCLKNADIVKLNEEELKELGRLLQKKSNVPQELVEEFDLQCLCVTYGEEGSDRLDGGCQSDLFLGGAGCDKLAGGDAADFMAGGSDKDEISLMGNGDIVAFNKNDGSDTVGIGSSVEKFTLSLGGGIGFDDIWFKRSGDNLVLELGEAAEQSGHGNSNRGGNGHGRGRGNGNGRNNSNVDSVVLEDWFGASGEGGNLNAVTLQVVTEASDDFDSNSADPLINQRIQQFDLLALSQTFVDGGASWDERWHTMDAMLSAHIGGSDSESMGGDIAYSYGMTGDLSGVSQPQVLSNLKDARFGNQSQAFTAS